MKMLWEGRPDTVSAIVLELHGNRGQWSQERHTLFGYLSFYRMLVLPDYSFVNDYRRLTQFAI